MPSLRAPGAARALGPWVTTQTRTGFLLAGGFLTLVWATVRREGCVRSLSFHSMGDSGEGPLANPIPKQPASVTLVERCHAIAGAALTEAPPC